MGWRRGFSDGDGGEPAAQISTGSTQYISEKGGNNAPVTYQDASGAPVEHDSPLGYSVNPVTLTLLNITMMIGAGIYSTPSSILGGTGSVGVSFVYWTLGYLVCHDAFERTRVCLANVFFLFSFVSPLEPSTWSSPLISLVDRVPKSFSSNKPTHVPDGYSQPLLPCRVSSYRSEVLMRQVSHCVKWCTSVTMLTSLDSDGKISDRDIRPYRYKLAD